MILFESDNGHKKVCIWKDEMPFKCNGCEKMHLCLEACEEKWYTGTICMEAKLGSRHISNYALVCMKYTDNQEDKTNILINFGHEDLIFQSQVLPCDMGVHVGLDEEFADAIEEFFKEYPYGKLPCGTIEILGGGYDEVGSSNVAFKKVMELIIFVFQHIDELSDDMLKNRLLNIM